MYITLNLMVMCEVNIKRIPRLQQREFIKETAYTPDMASVSQEVTVNITTEQKGGKIVVIDNISDVLEDFTHFIFINIH